MFIIGILTATHTIHKKTVITIAFIYASVSSTPVKIELVFINTAGEYAFTFGMILNKYANSTVLPIHRTTPILFFNSDEKSTIRHITHTPNRHHIATYLDKSFVSTSSNVPDLYSLVNISLKISTKAISATGIFSK